MDRHTNRTSRRMRRNSSMARCSRPGFSLLELTLVLLIIGALMGVAAINIMGQGTRANIRVTGATLSTVGQAVVQYQLNNQSTLPDTLQRLIDTQYLDPGSDDDAWGTDLFYSNMQDNATGNAFVLMSAGPNKEYGDEDDIDYWQVREES